jgi:hypothetical protein
MPKPNLPDDHPDSPWFPYKEPKGGNPLDDTSGPKKHPGIADDEIDNTDSNLMPTKPTIKTLDAARKRIAKYLLFRG